MNRGFRHNISIEGTALFIIKVNRALALIKNAEYDDFFSACIRQIREVDGFAQLRKSDATIWANKYTVDNPVDAASVFIQKASQMKEYLEGILYFGGEAEKRSITKRIEFLETLKEKTKKNSVREECDRLLRFWRESALVY
jgi:hypothetical protein